MAPNVEEEPATTDSEWPMFRLRYTFNPQELEGRDCLSPDELVVFDPSCGGDLEGEWVTAERGGYVAIEDAR